MTRSSSPPRRASRESCRSGTATPWGARWNSGGRWGRSCASSAAWARRPPGSGSSPPGSISGPPTTCSPTSLSSGRPPGTCPMTAPSSSSAFATSSATGGWPSTPPSAPRSTPRGRWPSAPGCASGPGSMSKSCTPMTASSCDCPTPMRSPRPTSPSSTPATSKPSSPRRSADRRCSRPGSANARPGRCCCPSATRGGGRRCGSSANARPSCSRSPGSTRRSPIILETMREVLQDVFDVPGLVGIMRDVEERRVRFVEVETPAPSPFARSLLFGYVAAFMYEGDSPLAERRAQALALDTGLLAELLGQAELRELLDAAALGGPRTRAPAAATGPPRPRRRGRRGPPAPARSPHHRRGGGPRGRAGVAGRA